MNRKTSILDPRSSVTPDTIDLKFGTRDYVMGATQHAKKLRTIGPAGTPRHTGEIYPYRIVFFNLVISSQALENRQRDISPSFLHQMTCFAAD